MACHRCSPSAYRSAAPPLTLQGAGHIRLDVSVPIYHRIQYACRQLANHKDTRRERQTGSRQNLAANGDENALCPQCVDSVLAMADCDTALMVFNLRA